MAKKTCKIVTKEPSGTKYFNLSGGDKRVMNLSKEIYSDIKDCKIHKRPKGSGSKFTFWVNKKEFKKKGHRFI